MKKFLLLGISALTAASVMALEPKTLEDYELTNLSPDGAYAGITNLMTGALHRYNVATGELGEGYGEDVMEYTVGWGRAFSADGVMVGSEYDRAAYLKNGEWHQLDVPDPMFSSYAQGISADGKMIVGMIGLTPVTLEDQAVPMKAPALWMLQDDGTYSDCIVLPYPEKDFTGRVPQYVTAMSVTDDLQTIVGQVVDYSGYFTHLITYTKGAGDEWIYNDSYSKMVNPNNVVFPEDPGEAPEYPDMTSFMTEEEKAAYEAALQAYYDSGYDETLYPDINDYMTAEEKAAYDAAMAKWEADMEAWNEKFEAFYGVLEEVMKDAKSMIYNNLILLADGKKVVSTVTVLEEDPTAWGGFSEYYAPITIDLATGTYNCKPASYDVLASSATSNGTILGWVDSNLGRITKIFLPGSDEAIGMIELLEKTCPETVNWAKENLIHDVITFDMETWEETVVPNTEVAGVPYVSDNMAVIATAAPVNWDSDVSLYSYIFQGVASGVEGVAADGEALAVKVLKGGVIELSAEADVVVYDLNGSKLYQGAGKTIETGLASGVYVVKVSANGETKVIKAIF